MARHVHSFRGRPTRGLQRLRYQTTNSKGRYRHAKTFYFTGKQKLSQANKEDIFMKLAGRRGIMLNPDNFVLTGVPQDTAMFHFLGKGEREKGFPRKRKKR